MGVAHGFDGRLMVGRETVYGTEVARVNSIEFMTEGVTLDSQPNVKSSLRGFQPRAHFGSTRKVAGDVLSELFFEGHEKLLEAAFGNMATVENEAGVRYTHTFTPTKLLPSLSAEIGRDVSTFLYTGVKVNTLSLGMVVDEILRATYGLVAQQEVENEPPTSDNFLAEKLPTYFQAVLEIDASPHDTREFNFTMGNNLAVDRFRLGTRLIKEPIRNDVGTFEGNFAADFESLTEYTKYVNGTEFSLVLTVTGPTLGTGNYLVVLTAPRCVYNGATPVVGGAGIIPQDFPFRALASDDLVTPAVTLAITNSIATP